MTCQPLKHADHQTLVMSKRAHIPYWYLSCRCPCCSIMSWWTRWPALRQRCLRWRRLWRTCSGTLRNFGPGSKSWISILPRLWSRYCFNYLCKTCVPVPLSLPTERKLMRCLLFRNSLSWLSNHRCMLNHLLLIKQTLLLYLCTDVLALFPPIALS